MSSSVVERFDAIVDVNRNRTCHPRKISAYHEHDAEFSEGVRETKNKSSQNPGPGKRQGYSKKGARAART